MAPSNLNQVFVMNSGTLATGSVFNTYNGTAAYSSLAVSAMQGGIWARTLSTGASAYAVAASPLFVGTTGLLTTTGQNTDFIQIVQGTTKANPIATPLIPIKDIRRVKVSAYAATTLHSQASVITAVPAAVAGVNGSWMVNLSIRTAPTFYEMFSNPSNGNLDLTTSAVGGLNKIFPLLGNFSAGRTIIPICEIPAGTAAATAALQIYDAILNNETLNSIVSFTAAQYATTTVTLTARHPGVIFDISIFDSVSKTKTVTPTTTGFNAGNGNYWQVISDEKAQRARYGHFNRMYFPFEQTNYAQSSGIQYASIELSYEHGWPSSTGIARAGELNTVKIYCPSGGLTTFGAILGSATAGDFAY